MRAAEDIFQSSRYMETVQRLQERDAENSFGAATPPTWFTDKNEPM